MKKFHDDAAQLDLSLVEYVCIQFNRLSSSLTPQLSNYLHHHWLSLPSDILTFFKLELDIIYKICKRKLFQKFLVFKYTNRTSSFCWFYKSEFGFWNASNGGKTTQIICTIQDRSYESFWNHLNVLELFWLIYSLWVIVN